MRGETTSIKHEGESRIPSGEALPSEAPTFAFSLSGCRAHGFTCNVLDYLAEAAVVGAVKHPPPAELAGFPEKAKDKRTIAKSHPAMVLLWFAGLPTRCSQAAGGAQDCPGSARALRLAARRSKQPRAPARSARGGQGGALPGETAPQHGAGQAVHQLGPAHPSPEHQPVLPGTITQPAAEGNTPASVPGTNSQSSATNS